MLMGHSLLVYSAKQAVCYLGPTVQGTTWPKSQGLEVSRVTPGDDLEDLQSTTQYL